LFGRLVATDQAARAFAYASVLRLKGAPEARFGASLLDPELVRAYNIRTALSAPFQTARCRGRLFVLDGATSEENLPLVSLIASRIGASLEARILRQSLEVAAAFDERAKLSRDLHDGVLQGLAAANMHLKVISSSLPPSLQEQLQTVRFTLADEARRVRNFVEANRATALSPDATRGIKPDLEKRVARLSDLWGCTIILTIDPPELSASLKTLRSIGHILAECVSNSVRHGIASSIEIGIQSRGEMLLVSVTDNGVGCKDLQGSYTGSELAEMNAGPSSLITRVEEARGTLRLHTSRTGTTIQLELPTW
jgi:signal transduction histidine kinase